MGRLAATQLAHKGVAGKGDMLDGVRYGTLELGCGGHVLHALHLLLDKGGLLVLLHLVCKEGLHLLVVPGEVALGMNAGEHCHQQMVVVATSMSPLVSASRRAARSSGVFTEGLHLMCVPKVS